MPQEHILKVTGMDCDGCVKAVTRAATGAGTAPISVDLKSGEMRLPASADIPAIMVTGGPSQPAYFRGRELGVGTDTWHYANERRAGRMSQEEFDELEAAATPSYGHCNEMGTASTMTSLVEALGMCLPGTASIPAVVEAVKRDPFGLHVESHCDSFGYSIGKRQLGLYGATFPSEW